MNENISKWTAALRSGDYRQGRGSLRRDDGFCCLGVACDIYLKETGRGSWRMNYSDDSGIGYTFRIDGVEERITLPTAVFDWLGIENIEENPKITAHYHDKLDTWINMNDHNSSFEEIANHIEGITEEKRKAECSE